MKKIILWCFLLLTDEKDLEECFESVDESLLLPNRELDSCDEVDQPPLAMLDSDGNLVAGSLCRHQTNKEQMKITLPDKILTELEEKFLSSIEKTGDSDMNQCNEKFKKYREGLEKGMQEFLNQEFADLLAPAFASLSKCRPNEVQKSNVSFDSTTKTRKYALTCPKGSSYGINDISHGRDTSNETSVVTKKQSSRTVSQKRDKLCGSSKSVQEGHLMLEAANGFILSLDRGKKVLFVSENVSEFLGHCQVRVFNDFLFA